MGKIWKIILSIVLSVFFILIVILGGNNDNNKIDGNLSGMPDSVAMWQPLVTEVANANGMGDYIPLLMAILWQESDGILPDVMQSSESLGLPCNAITDPRASIEAGIKHLKNVMDYGNARKVDFPTIIQCYNYGPGYADFIASHGGIHSNELSAQFSALMASKSGSSSYGHPTYAEEVLQKMQGVSTGDGLSTEQFNALMQEALKYQGWPYKFGGSDPTIGFDCSGLVQWTYKTIGITLPRTAQGQYEQCTIIPNEQAKPGDLVFLTGTYDCDDYITHVAIYLGDNMKVYQSGGSGIGYVDYSTSYYQEHWVGIGRIKH